MAGRGSWSGWSGPCTFDRPMRRRRLLVFLPLLALVGVVLVRCAWQCDDAYVTFRTVWNFWHGFGLRWNVTERVQAYSSPAWMVVALLCYGATDDVYTSTLVVS